MFPTGDQFDLDALDGDGAGGVAFTGAPRYAGHTCDVCHVGGDHTIGAALQADPVGVFSDGYAPGSNIHFRVVLTGEHAGLSTASAGDNCGDFLTPYVACDDNGFSLELDDALGRPTGTFSPIGTDGTCATAPVNGADVRVLDDGTAITHEGVHHGVTQWDLCWKAPVVGTGRVFAYVSVVDGNGGNGKADYPNDSFGDDTFAGAVPMIEKGGTPATEGGGCDAGGGGAGTVVIGAIVLAILGLGACAHVPAQQREILAKRKMVFAPDPAEDELDLHMQEAREGSAGGYGSAGGGCGCN
jgi:hypothetical protein